MNNADTKSRGILVGRDSALSTPLVSSSARPGSYSVGNITNLVLLAAKTAPRTKTYRCQGHG
ncbi:hypothetical protein C0Q70_11050 [Pomacea canaliculata]|uniref:Uncharacterized protein n=1 Tax=Pomacea canaliculata TaxID=400727 RepID=A0A2T7P4W0_POMCA|nr:hypothetical protein C0Q70_11050 [Pomacea canaliculata]